MLAVLLAAGRGTRMRSDEEADLEPRQAAIADLGLKALIPFHGHPYLAYVLHEIAEAGFTEVVLVVPPGRDHPVRVAAEELRPRRLRLRFAVQEEPNGVAHALLAAEAEVGDRDCVVLNADNVSPAAALERLRGMEEPGLLAFDRHALTERSNIPPDRVAAYAVITEKDGYLDRIIEKPGPATLHELAAAPVSMTCWRFGPSIFRHCRDVEPSPRGELELPAAVELAMERGERFRVVHVEHGVLDLSRRSDIPAVEQRLRGREPRL